MFKEIVEFSKNLEEKGIYEETKKQITKLDKPIVVLPIINKNKEFIFDIDNIFIVVKNKIRKEDKDIYLLDDMNNKQKEIIIDNKITTKIIDDIKNKDFKKSLTQIPLLIKKLPGNNGGNKSIGGNKGTNSYHLLIFLGKTKTNSTKGIFEDENTFKKKFKKQYEKIEDIFQEIIGNDIFNLLTQLSDNNISSAIWERLNPIFSNVKENKKGYPLIKEFYFFIKLPDDKIIKNKNNLYITLYETHLYRKIFAQQNTSKKGKCLICNNKDIDLYLPTVFNNLSGYQRSIAFTKKPFTLHIDRPNIENLYCCRDCSLNLVKFTWYFLPHISFFPLFIDNTLNKKVITLFKKGNGKKGNNKIENLAFKEIMQEVAKNTDSTICDFYLIIYTSDILAFDYITGFRFAIKDKTVFDIEELISKTFFEDRLIENYFSDNINKQKKKEKEELEKEELEKVKYLNILFNRYRTKIFDYVYRAKYNSLSQRDIETLFFETLKIQLKHCYGKDKKYSLNFNNFYILDKYFGGDFMGKIEEIEKSQDVSSIEGLTYYLGQAVYYLLSLSKASNKTHAMVEPFINVASFKIVALKFEELFNTYKHELHLNQKKMNNWFSKLWKGLIEHKNKEFNKDLKMIFYAGYFNSENNVFYKKEEEKNGK